MYFWLGCFVTIYCCGIEKSVNAVDPQIVNALLMESLKNHLVQACEGEKTTLHCPRNTHILVTNTFYGRLVPSSEFCTPANPSNVAVEDTSCDVIEAHSKVLDVCRNKRRCNLSVEPSFFERDPCPNTSKYLQISYKCRPVSFDDRTFCDGSTMQLNCKINKRIAIYSAVYGRTLNDQAMHCTPYTPILQDCTVDVLSQLLYECHAQTECAVAVDEQTFGNPCPMGVTKHLSLIFMCVSDEVFTEAAINGDLEAMMDITKEINVGGRKSYASKGFFRENSSNMATIIQNYADEQRGVIRTALVKKKNGKQTEDIPHIGHDHVASDVALLEKNVAAMGVQYGWDGWDHEKQKERTNAIVIARDLLLIIDLVERNKEKAILFASVGIAVGIFVLLVMCIACHCVQSKQPIENQRKRLTNSTKCSSLVESYRLSPNNNDSSLFFDSERRAGFDLCDLMSDGQSYTRLSQVSSLPLQRIPPMNHYS
ncbi:hypothetical protein AB6A40_000435 [Gnathostoma spinigerum]|uniref:SUEL-type lectin domain-containing protein n=1 Tax=Gnathostoma spinigerum TaxID=75299 RepID=A0ABD6E444_9BILA